MPGLILIPTIRRCDMKKAETKLMTTTNLLLDPKPRCIASDQALHVARLDAEAAYGDLDRFCISIALEPDGWHVDYELKDPTLDGGGPQYVIDRQSGEIAAKRYEQ